MATLLDAIRFLGIRGAIRYMLDRDRRHGSRIHPLDWEEAEREPQP